MSGSRCIMKCANGWMTSFHRSPINHTGFCPALLPTRILVPLPNQPKKKSFVNKYQDRFAINTPTTAEFDPSTISAYTGSNRRSPRSNAWHNGPPIDASYDPTEPCNLAAEFPPLMAPHPLVNGGYGPQAPREPASTPIPLRDIIPLPQPDCARAERGFGRPLPPILPSQQLLP